MKLNEIRRCSCSIKRNSMKALEEVINRVIPSYLVEGKKLPSVGELDTMFFTSFRFENREEELFRSPKLSLKGKLKIGENFSENIIEFLDCYSYLKYVVSPGSIPRGLSWFNENVKNKVDNLFAPGKLIYDYNENTVPGFIRTSVEIKEEEEKNNMLNTKFPYFLYNLSKWGQLTLNTAILSITLKENEDISIYIVVISDKETDNSSCTINIKFKEPYFNKIREKGGEEGEKSIYDLIEEITGIDELTLLSLQADEDAFVTTKKLD